MLWSIALMLRITVIKCFKEEIITVINYSYNRITTLLIEQRVTI